MIFRQHVFHNTHESPAQSTRYPSPPSSPSPSFMVPATDRAFTWPVSLPVLLLLHRPELPALMSPFLAFAQSAAFGPVSNRMARCRCNPPRCVEIGLPTQRSTPCVTSSVPRCGDPFHIQSRQFEGVQGENAHHIIPQSWVVQNLGSFSER